jgi:hypothetical protein
MPEFFDKYEVQVNDSYRFVGWNEGPTFELHAVGTDQRGDLFMRVRTEQHRLNHTISLNLTGVEIPDTPEIMNDLRVHWGDNGLSFGQGVRALEQKVLRRWPDVAKKLWGPTLFGWSLRGFQHGVAGPGFAIWVYREVSQEDTGYTWRIDWDPDVVGDDDPVLAGQSFKTLEEAVAHANQTLTESHPSVADHLSEQSWLDCQPFPFPSRHDVIARPAGRPPAGAAWWSCVVDGQEFESIAVPPFGLYQARIKGTNETAWGFNAQDALQRLVMQNPVSVGADGLRFCGQLLDRQRKLDVGAGFRVEVRQNDDLQEVARLFDGSHQVAGGTGTTAREALSNLSTTTMDMIALANRLHTLGELIEAHGGPVDPRNFWERLDDDE